MTSTLHWTIADPPNPTNPSHSFAFGEQSYARMLAGLLPRGPVFDLLGEELKDVLNAIAVELARVDARAKDLLEEADPRTATETLSDWELMLGLPDDRVLEIAATDAERRLAIVQKFVSLAEGQDLAFFTRLFLACGYVLVEIDLFANSVLRVGFRVGDRCYDDVYAYSMECKYNAPAGDALDLDTLKRVVRKATHAHIQVIFTEV